MDALDAAIKKQGADSFVHYASSDDADMRYLSRIVMHDPFVFFKNIRQPGTIIVSQMECERAARESPAAVITRTQAGLPDIIKTEKDPWKATAKMIAGQTGRKLLVSPNFPAALVRALEEFADVAVDDGTIGTMREIKTRDEIRLIKNVQKNTEAAMEFGISFIRNARVRKGILVHDGKPLTSEFLRTAMHKYLMDAGCRAVETIVTCGKDTALPHAIGTGPLMANEPIVIDMFPKDETSGYFADMTRTVSKGTPDRQIVEMYDAVKDAQALAVSRIRAKIPGCEIHNAVVDLFKERGFESNTKGFTHNLGHGVGLQVHELPTVGPSGTALKAGQVITVEPGLYYPDTGGVRLEDMGAVTAKGFLRFTNFPEELIV